MDFRPRHPQQLNIAAVQTMLVTENHRAKFKTPADQSLACPCSVQMKKGNHMAETTAKSPETGDTAPSFSLPQNGNEVFSSSSLAGKAYVLYFYPKDDTSGCTREAVDFTALKPEFDAIGVEIIGVSPDSTAKHDKFISKHELSLALLADEEKTLSSAYGVWVEKSMYGRKYMGIERSTFLIGQDGKVVQVWRKVKVAGHAQAVLDAARALNNK